MANISAADVKRLRDTTQCGMLDCKKALIETDGNFEEAVDLLRKKAGIKADKKAGREANEGLTASVVEGKVGAIVQVACETDFVAKTDRFQDFVNSLAQRVVGRSDSGDVTEALSEEVAEELKGLIGTIGENMKIIKAVRYSTEGQVGTYLHAGGKIGVLVEVEGTDDEALIKDICMHIAAMSPTYISPDDIPAEDVEKEKSIAAEKHAGKPADIIDKILMGHINKWYTDICLMKQSWFKEDKSTLEKVAPNVKVKRFERLQAGA
ncbi:MAG: translation elongation factor Ts [Lentisphaeraceae bacterium]|nr:translation elongation factor Ts [Lentisphaeraceae bacterium]